MKGFTLIETVLSIAIMSLLMASLYALLSSGNMLYTTDAALVTMQQNLRTGMERIVREVRESKSSTITTLSANADSISFITPTKIGVQYYLQGDRLIREYPAGSMTIIASGFSRLKFTKADTVLRVDMQAAGTVNQRPLTLSLSEQVRLRNEY